MIPIAAIKYTILAGIMVISILVGIRCLFAHEMLRETWRTAIRRYIYFSRTRFKIVTITFGLFSLIIGLSVAYVQVIGLLSK